MAFDQKLCDERHANIDSKLDKILLVLEGNGKLGHNVRLDRVEQKWKQMIWFLAPIYIAFIGMVVEKLITVIHQIQ